MASMVERLTIQLIGDASSYLSTMGMASTATIRFQAQMRVLQAAMQSAVRGGLLTMHLIPRIQGQMDAARIAHATELQTINLTSQIARSFARLAADLTGGAIFQALSLAGAMERAQITFGVLMRNVDAGRELATTLQGLGATTPINTATWMHGAETLLQYGVAGNQVVNILRSVGDIVGPDTERFRHMSMAIGQVVEFGHLMGQELRQMINAGFNPLLEISERTGRSMDELRGIMRGGGISAQAVINAFRAATGPGGRFFQMLAQQAQSLTGRFNQMVGSIQLALARLGSDIADALMLRQIMQGITAIINFVGQMWDALPAPIRQAIIVVGVLIAAVASFALIWAALSGPVMMVLGALSAGLAALMTPIGMVIAAIAIMFTILRGPLLAAWEAIAPIVWAIGGIFKAVWDGIVIVVSTAWQAIVAMFTGLWNAFTGLFTGMASLAGTTWTGIRDGIVKAIVMCEFVMRNFFNMVQLGWHISLLGMVTFGNQLIYFFGTVIPATIVWFGTNFKEIIRDVFSYGTTVMSNLASNIATIVMSIPGLISGGLSFSDVRSMLLPLEQGFERTSEQLVIPDRIIGQQEQALTTLVEMETNALGRSYAAFEQDRLDAIYGRRTNPVGAAEQLGFDIGNGMAKKAHKGSQKMEQTLLDSAEAATRLMHQADLLGSDPWMRRVTVNSSFGPNMEWMTQAVGSTLGSAAQVTGGLTTGNTHQPSATGAFSVSPSTFAPVPSATAGGTAVIGGSGEATSILRDIYTVLNRIYQRLGGTPTLVPAQVASGS